MTIKKIIKAKEAAELVKDGDVIATTGFVGSALPEELTSALENRFVETNKPNDLTLIYAAGQGNRDGSGADHFAHKGMTKRVIAGHYNLAPKLGELILNNEIEGYNFPQGTLSQLFRASAGRKPGILTHVGLNTFVDPKVSGGKLNDITKEDLVERIEIFGEEKLIFKSINPDVCFLRATYADEYGNCTVENEVTTTEVTSVAQAAKNNGGTVIVQVEKVVKAGSLDPKLVKIPGIYVDYLVVTEETKHEQIIGQEFDPSLSGQVVVPVESDKTIPLDAKKIIARRAALFLEENSVVNLGIGVPEYVSTVANEEGIGDYMTLTVEAGAIGGVPLGGAKFGAARNAEVILDQAYQFDFYDGSGIDLAFLGLAEADRHGNINVSKFGVRLAGCGGFINITQNAKKVFYLGTFTAGGLRTEVQDGKLVITQEGKNVKFVEDVDQITFSGEYANKVGQPVYYITERAVFELTKEGVKLIEVAPGIDVESQVLKYMKFKPIVADDLKLMDERIFREEKMGLK